MIPTMYVLLYIHFFSQLALFLDTIQQQLDNNMNNPNLETQVRFSCKESCKCKQVGKLAIYERCSEKKKYNSERTQNWEWVLHFKDRNKNFTQVCIIYFRVFFVIHFFCFFWNIFYKYWLKYICTAWDNRCSWYYNIRLRHFSSAIML